MKSCWVVLLLFAALSFAQTANILIYDSEGNQTIGTINNGNVYFHDSNGNSTFGTIRDGSVFLTTSKGEITFGTIRNGDIFLTDSKGVTTGTIRNGNIFLNNSDGSITTGTYSHSGELSTNTSTTNFDTEKDQPSHPSTPSKASPTSCTTFLDCFVRGAAQTANKPQKQSTATARNEPALTALGTTPDPDETATESDEVRAFRLMEGLRNDIRELQSSVDHDPLKEAVESNKVQVAEKNRAAVMAAIERQREQALEAIKEAKSSWLSMREIYCVARPQGKYIDLDGKQQSCNPR